MRSVCRDRERERERGAELGGCPPQVKCNRRARRGWISGSPKRGKLF